MVLAAGSLEGLVMSVHADFWRDKRVLVTGHSGFKGSWLVLWLKNLGASVMGLSLPPETEPNLFELAKIDNDCNSHWGDILDPNSMTSAIQGYAPQIVFHLAAQALVLRGYEMPVETFSTNILGTANLLEAVRYAPSVKVVVAVTTDKVYENKNQLWPFRESDALGGHDPYSASKAAAELVIASYRKSYLSEMGVAVASARAGNVIGGGDWSSDRLIPDAVRAWQDGGSLYVRHPDAVRPWQHVLEALSGYLVLAEQLWQRPQLADAYNFGPYPHESANVRNVIELAHKVYDEGDIVWGDTKQGSHEAAWLALETAKSRSILGVTPRWCLDEAVHRTTSWYRDVRDGMEARTACLRDIDAYRVELEK